MLEGFIYLFLRSKLWNISWEKEKKINITVTVITRLYRIVLARRAFVWLRWITVLP